MPRIRGASTHPKKPSAASLRTLKGNAAAEARACRFENLLLNEPVEWMPYREYRFHPVRKWRFDFGWPMHRVAVESNGGGFIAGRHNRGVGAEKDWEKLNEAQLAGWIVLQVPSAKLCTPETIALVKRALEARQ